MEENYETISENIVRKTVSVDIDLRPIHAELLVINDQLLRLSEEPDFITVANDSKTLEMNHLLARRVELRKILKSE